MQHWCLKPLIRALGRSASIQQLFVSYRCPESHPLKPNSRPYIFQTGLEYQMAARDIGMYKGDAGALECMEIAQFSSVYGRM
jgi:hypothetical protein